MLTDVFTKGERITGSLDYWSVENQQEKIGLLLWLEYWSIGAFRRYNNHFEITGSLEYRKSAVKNRPFIMAGVLEYWSIHEIK